MSTKRSCGAAALNNVDPSQGAAPKGGKVRIVGPVNPEWEDTLHSIAKLDTGAKIDPKINIDNLEPIQCPCCRQQVKAPTLELVIDRFEISDQQALILKAVWDGRGFPVQTERIFDVMYADDPNGGPSPSKMYLAFKVGLHHLRQKLKGSGIGIKNVGYRQGYRLVIGEE